LHSRSAARRRRGRESPRHGRADARDAGEHADPDGIELRGLAATLWVDVFGVGLRLSVVGGVWHASRVRQDLISQSDKRTCATSASLSFLASFISTCWGSDSPIRSCPNSSSISNTATLRTRPTSSVFSRPVLR